MIWKKALTVIKILLILLFGGYSLFVLWVLFLSPKEDRFQYASHIQGKELSQFIFDNLTITHPDYDKAYFEQSVPYVKRGDFQKEFELLNKAIRLNPKGHLGYRGYIKLRFLRDYKGALQDFNELDSLTPNFTDASWGEDIDFLRGECFYGLKEFKKAISCFNKSIENQGEEWVDVQAFVYLGMCYNEGGGVKKAISSYKRTFDQAEKTPEAYYYLAKVYFELDSIQLAKINIENAKENMIYKRDDPYNEYLNEIYQSDVEALMTKINSSVE